MNSKSPRDLLYNSYIIKISHTKFFYPRIELHKQSLDCQSILVFEAFRLINLSGNQFTLRAKWFHKSFLVLENLNYLYYLLNKGAEN